MRSVNLTIGTVCLCVCTAARAETVAFDFDSLAAFAWDNAISNYMTAVYGSTVTTDGARATNERNDGRFDRFIATSLQLLNRGDFEILFEDIPIVGAQFEGHVIEATAGDDFSFLAFAGDTLVASFSRNDGSETFDSGWIALSQPVDRIVISDTGRKDVGVDNLVVQPVPEPSTALLALVGAGALLRRRRTRAAR